MDEYENARIAEDIPWHSELSYNSNGTLIINFDYYASDVWYYISDYAPITREIIFNITFPEPEHYWPTRTQEELNDIIDVLNHEFDFYGCELTFYLCRYDQQQIACALCFHNLDVIVMFEYYIGGECQNRVEVDSYWYAELIDNHGSDGSQNDSYESDYSSYGEKSDDDDQDDDDQ